MTEEKAKTSQIPLTLIDEPVGIIRMEIDAEYIAELAESIANLGQLQPILVRPVGDRYEIVYGHCRFLAHRRLGRDTIICTVRELSDVETSLMRATENIQRKDISPIEEAKVYKDLGDLLGLSVDEIAKRMGKSAGVVRRRLDLLKMPPQLQVAVHKKQIGYNVAESLWSLGDIGKIDYYLAFCIEHGATLAVVNEWVHEAKAQARQVAAGVGGGREVLSPMESRPVYVACDICQGPMVIGEETVIRACRDCVTQVHNATRG